MSLDELLSMVRARPRWRIDRESGGGYKVESSEQWLCAFPNMPGVSYFATDLDPRFLRKGRDERDLARRAELLLKAPSACGQGRPARGVVHFACQGGAGRGGGRAFRHGV